MGNIFFSPNDPIFWMHHAYIDCIWEEFREDSQKTNIATEYPGNFGQQPHHPQALMEPFSDFVASVKNIEGLSTFITSACYKCDRRPRCPDCGNTPNLYCDSSDNRCKPYISSNNCGEDTALVPAVIYCDRSVYGNQNYGVNGVYLETEGVSYKGRNQVYYFGDYNNYYNLPRSSRPSSSQPKYVGYFPTRRPRTRYVAAGRKKRQTASEQYKPKAYTADGRQCKIECLSGYRGLSPTYGPCSTGISMRGIRFYTSYSIYSYVCNSK